MSHPGWLLSGLGQRGGQRGEGTYILKGSWGRKGHLEERVHWGVGRWGRWIVTCLTSEPVPGPWRASVCRVLFPPAGPPPWLLLERTDSAAEGPVADKAFLPHPLSFPWKPNSPSFQKGGCPLGTARGAASGNTHRSSSQDLRERG